MPELREGVVFGLMTEEEQKALRNAQATGSEIQAMTESGWLRLIHMPGWFKGTAYRIAPPPVVPFTVDPIVWQVLDKRWRWITQDEDGPYVWAGSRPLTSRTYWSGEDHSFAISLDTLLAPGLIQRGTCPWQEAIAERPPHAGKEGEE